MFEQRQSGGGDNGKFISLKNDGDSVKGVFAGKPYTYFQHWMGQRPSVCTVKTPQGCPACRDGNKAKSVFRCNLIVSEGNGYVAKILEKGMSVYDKLFEYSTEYDLTKTLLKITRKGSGMETSYSVIVAPPAAQPTAEQLAQMMKVTLLELDPNKDNDVSFAAGGDSQVPF